MERLSIRRPSGWAVLLAALLAALLAVALVAFAHRESAAKHVPKLTIADAMLAVAKANDPVFLHYDTVTGPASTSDHKDHAVIISASFDTSRTITSGVAGGGREVGDPKVKEVCLTKVVDKYSPKLYKEALTGTPRTSILYFTKTAKAPYGEYMRFEMFDTLISSFHFTGSSTEQPTESICLNFTKLNVVHTAPGQPAESTSWDFVAHAPLP